MDTAQMAEFEQPSGPDHGLQKRSKNLPTLFLIQSLMVMLSLSGAIAETQTRELLLEGIQILKETRTKAEHWARILKGMGDDISSTDYQDGELLYVEAKAEFDGWIERVIVDLKSGGQTAISETQTQDLKDAEILAQSFFEFVSDLRTGGGGRGSWIGIIPDTIAAVTDAGLKIWREIKSVKSEERQAFVKRLEDLRWKPFNEVAPSREAPRQDRQGTRSPR